MTVRADPLASIRGGEDTNWELKEVVVSRGRVAFGGKQRQASSGLSEVFVSMANTDRGFVIRDVRDLDGPTSGGSSS